MPTLVKTTEVKEMHGNMEFMLLLDVVLACDAVYIYR